MRHAFLPLLSFLFLTMSFASLWAVQTLDLDFSRDRSAVVASVAHTPGAGRVQDGALLVGAEGFSLPALPLLGQNEGTILFRARFEEPREPRNTMRTLVTLRTASRLYAGYYFFGDKRWAFVFSDQDKTFRMEMTDLLEPGRAYDLGFSWDGQWLRLFQDGKILAETEQPLPVDKLTQIHIGPYADGWIGTNPWCDDTRLETLKVFNTALTPQEVAKFAGVEFQPLAKTHPQRLSVPPLSAGVSAPVNDGLLSEEAWKHAASVPRLIQGNYPQESGSLPDHHFWLTYDQENLYVAFDTHFPPHQPFVEGNLRTPESEPEVWGSESVEVYLQTDAVYRFAGNIAGGYCEGRGMDTAWNGAWTYNVSRSMKIDDSYVWQGEMTIPWKTVGLDGPPAGDLRINCCRSWKLPDFGQHSSLDVTGEGYAVDAMVPVSFGPAPILQIPLQGNPNNGDFQQEYLVESAQGGKVTYDLSLAKLDGSALPLSILHRSWNLKPGENVSDKASTTIGQAEYDCLMYTLDQDGQVATRFLIPFRLDETLFTITPLYLQGKIRVTLKDAILNHKFGKDFRGRLVLKNAAGEELSAIASDSVPVELPFDRAWAAGNYQIVLEDGEGNALASENAEYPGIGEWESQVFPEDVIIPPFDPMTSQAEEGRLACQVSLREYQWDNRALPTQFVSQGVPLLSSPVELLLDGHAAAADEFRTGLQKPHRVEFTAAGRGYRNDGWLEYDGVQWNRMTVSPDAGAVAIRFTMPAEQAKYLHGATTGGVWGAKATLALPEGTTTVRYYSSIWIGDEERGLCFFSENRNGWTADARDALVVEKSGDVATVTFRICSDARRNAPLEIGIGFLATPIRPFAKNYPYDTFNWSYASPMNRDVPIPAQDVEIIDQPYGVYRGDLGSFFADTNDRDGNSCAESYRIAFERQTNGHHVRPVPYLCGRYLSAKYPEMRAFKAEWSFRPELAQDYDNTGHFIYDCCPASPASAFFAHKVRTLLTRFPEMKGLYFDFGNAPECSNGEHGCHGGQPLLAQREFYRRMCLVQMECGIESPVIVLHNTDCDLLPTYTFASHLFNGEHIRQDSSPLLHNKKTILDTYGIEMFASELSSLPFGITNSVYFPVDTLRPENGGDEETDDYQFRLGKAEHAATLIHNTVMSPMRNHYGMFDKIMRAFANFGVGQPDEHFVGYWKNAVRVEGAKDIYVSCHVRGDKVLAVVGHVGKSHDDQTFDVVFDWNALGVANPPFEAKDCMTAPDPEYQELQERQAKFGVPPERAPLRLGDFGSQIHSFQGNTLHLSLEHHSFAIIELR